MAAIHTIKCKELVSEDGINYVIDTKSFDKYTKDITIVCDNEEDNNSFTLEYYGDEGIMVTRNRCELTINLKPNLTQFDKQYTVICTHANDSEVYIQINISQPSEEFSINIQKETISFKSVLTSANIHNDDLFPYEKQTLKVEVNGGSKKFRIRSIHRLHENANLGVIEHNVFDNGFIITKLSDSIEIKSYGRPFNDYDTYLITLCHNDDKTITATLTVSYNKITGSNAVKRKKTVKQIDTIEEKLNMLHSNDIEVEEITPVEYGMSFVGDFTDYVILDQETDKELNVLVTEDGEDSNLMIKVYASGNWCRAILDETNRKIKFSIVNKPLCERRSYVKVSVVDVPECYKDFILINKPS